MLEQIVDLVRRVNDPRGAPQQDKPALLHQLDAFRQSPQCWQLSCEFLRNNNQPDPAVSLFFLNCIEAYCASLVRFESIPAPQGRVHVRETLLSLLLMPSAETTMLQRKASAILVLMGQREFASSWPDFAQFCVQPGTPRILLLAACQGLPDASLLTTKFRQEDLQRYCNNVAGPLFVSALASSPAGLLHLECVLALTEWVPLQHLTFDFIQSFAGGGGESAGSMVIHALANILDRNYFPTQQPQSGMFLSMISSRALALLEQQQQAQIDPEAVLAFLHPFTKRHFAKLSSVSTSFPVERFLEAMFSFTFSLRTVELFYQALEVWELFIESCQEFELEHQTSSRLAAPVIAPLLVRLLEMFLFAKTQAPASFLTGLAASYTLNGEEDEGESNSKKEDGEEGLSDLDVIVQRIMHLVQRTSFLPFSSAAGLSALLQSCYTNLGQCTGKLGTDSSAAHDCVVNLCIVATCAPALFTREAFAGSPQIADLAQCAVSVAEQSLTHAWWQQSKQYVRLHGQALVCAKSLLPWARHTQNAAYSHSVRQIVLATLAQPMLPEEAKLKAVLVLAQLPDWTAHLPASASLFAFTSPMSDVVRGKVYAAFALRTLDDQGQGEQALTQAVQRDVELASTGKDHERKRSLSALQSVVEIVHQRPETQVKSHVYHCVCLPTVPACLQILANINTNSSPGVLARALDFLLASFKHLRRQLGDQGCSQICQQAMQCCSANTTSAGNEVRVLLLLQCVVEEPTAAFDSLLGGILALCAATLQGTNSNSSSSGEVEEATCRVVFALLLNHWKWLAPQPQPQAVVTITSLLISKISMQTPPDLVRELCHCLCASNTKNSLFKHPHFQQHAQPQALFQQCMQLIASRERDMIADQLMQTLFALANANADFFVQHVWPSTNSTNSTTPWDKTLKDQGLFEEAVLAVVV